METELIRYNLNERGRSHRGKDRFFDIPKIVRAINSPATQERVRHRDMFGYFGHWPRLKFGMNPAEGGIVDGRHVSIEPAIVTTYLKAFDDGTIEHRAEFLEQHASGRIAAKMYKSKTGGFSSAIVERIPQFFGFDYVMEPNYSTNRGYELSLDSVEDGVLLDSVVEYNHQMTGLCALLDSVTGAHDQTLQAMQSVMEENERLQRLVSGRVGTLDALEDCMPGISDRQSRMSWMMRQINGFKVAPVATFEKEKPKEDPAAKGFSVVTDRIMPRR